MEALTVLPSLEPVPVALGALTVLLGLKSLTQHAATALGAAYDTLVRPGKNLKKFGQWAVVTGATDGIGKAYAFELARKGMNVFLISRTESKLRDVEAELKAKYSNVSVAHLAVDFSNFDLAAQQRVSTALLSLDVGVLVNNVGASYRYAMYFHELTHAEVDQLVQLNVHSTTWMTHLVLPAMLERKRGAIVNVSSMAGHGPCPLLAMYSGTKSFVERFSQSLDAEYRHKGVAVNVHVPLYVTTKLSKLRKETLFTCSPTAYARAAVRRIGYDAKCSPYWSHGLQMWLYDMLPESFQNTMVAAMHKDIRGRGRKKDAKKAAESGSAE